MRIIRMILLLTAITVGIILAAEAAAGTAISFPCRIEGTDLYITKQIVYEGPVWRGEEMELACNVAAVLIENRGERYVKSLSITLSDGGEEYTFQESMIPAGCKILIPEQGLKRWQGGDLIIINRECTCCDSLETGILLTQVSMDTFIVQNSTDEAVEQAWIYYKSYYRDDDLLIGGSDFREEIRDLLPGQSREVKLSHYAMGSSKIVAIENTGTFD